MCTLILGRDVVGPGSVLLAANRDEDPGRPSDPPGVLLEHPRVVGGRDRRAGGTWLAIREGRAAVAILNRRDAAAPAGRRSRGALAMDVASVAEDFPARLDVTGERRETLERLREVSGGGLAHAALCRAFAALWEDAYAPFTLVFAAAESCWLLVLDAGAPRCQTIGSGWHVLTHADLDDTSEPRTAWLVRELSMFAPRAAEPAEQRLSDLLRSHGDPAAGRPAVCLHDGRMQTVSSSMVWLGGDGARYRHADGRPCETPFDDRSALLALNARLP